MNGELLTATGRRLMRIERLLRSNRVNMARLHRATGASRATLKRDIARLREDLGADIFYHRSANEYELRNPQWPGVVRAIERELMRLTPGTAHIKTETEPA